MEQIELTRGAKPFTLQLHDVIRIDDGIIYIVRNEEVLTVSPEERCEAKTMLLLRAISNAPDPERQRMCVRALGLRISATYGMDVVWHNGNDCNDMLACKKRPT